MVFKLRAYCIEWQRPTSAVGAVVPTSVKRRFQAVFEFVLSCSCFVELKGLCPFYFEIFPWDCYRRYGKTTAHLFTFRLVKMGLASVGVQVYGLPCRGWITTPSVCSPDTVHLLTPLQQGASSASESVSTTQRPWLVPMKRVGAVMKLENCALLGCYAASVGNFLPTFRETYMSPWRWDRYVVRKRR